MEYCEVCGSNMVEEFDYLSTGPGTKTLERNGKCQYAVPCVEQLTCYTCQPRRITPLREGMAYWTPESWEAEAEPDEVVWDNEP